MKSLILVTLVFTALSTYAQNKGGGSIGNANVSPLAESTLTIQGQTTSVWHVNTHPVAHYRIHASANSGRGFCILDLTFDGGQYLPGGITPGTVLQIEKKTNNECDDRNGYRSCITEYAVSNAQEKLSGRFFCTDRGLFSRTFSVDRINGVSENVFFME